MPPNTPPIIGFHPNRRRIELSFDGIPSPSIRNALKSACCQWDGRNRVWYQYRSTAYDHGARGLKLIDKQAELLAFCKRTWGVTDAEIKAINEAVDFAAAQAGERGMEEACGIA